MGPGQTIVYISDVGAQYLQPLFIAGCVLTTIFLDAGFIADRILRHRGVLASSTSRVQSALSYAAIVCAVAGTVGLILLSIFDTLRHMRLHNSFLALFIIGYVLTAIFLCAEYQRLGRKYRQHRVLRASFWIKLAFVVVEVGLAIGFGVCGRQGMLNAAAILEWSIALIFTFWVMSFVVDLAPASRGEQRVVGPRAKAAEEGRVNGHGAGRAREEYGMDGYGGGGGGYRAPVEGRGARPNPAGNF